MRSSSWKEMSGRMHVTATLSPRHKLGTHGAGGSVGSKNRLNSFSVGSKNRMNSFSVGSKNRLNSFSVGSKNLLNSFSVGSKNRLDSFPVGSKNRLNSFPVGSKHRLNSSVEQKNLLSLLCLEPWTVQPVAKNFSKKSAVLP